MMFWLWKTDQAFTNPDKEGFPYIFPFHIPRVKRAFPLCDVPGGSLLSESPIGVLRHHSLNPKW